MEELIQNRVWAKKGDITKCKVDAIVNAANSSLMGGGGVDGTIHRAGGSSILAECKDIRANRYPQGLPPGEAVITAAGNLPATYVIHTVGPVWREGTAGENKVLEQAYRNSLSLAKEQGVTSVAFPAISTGVYGYPKGLAAIVAFHTINAFTKDQQLPREIYLVFFSDPDYELFLQSVTNLRKG